MQITRRRTPPGRGGRLPLATRLLVLLTAIGSLAGARLPQPPLPSADSVIEEYLRAIGGRAALASVHSRRLHGTYVEGTLHATTDMAWQRPALRRVNVHAPGFEYSEGFDGTTWEYDAAKGTVKRDTGAANDAGRRGAEFDESFIDYAAKGHHVALVGLDTLRQRAVYHLRVTLADGWVKEYYFDTQTHLIAALRKAMPVHATGPSVTTLTFYDEWTRDGAVLQAHTFVEREAGTDRLMTTLHWERVEINPTLTPEELHPPLQRN